MDAFPCTPPPWSGNKDVTNCAVTRTTTSTVCCIPKRRELVKRYDTLQNPSISSVGSYQAQPNPSTHRNKPLEMTPRVFNVQKSRCALGTHPSSVPRPTTPTILTDNHHNIRVCRKRIDTGCKPRIRNLHSLKLALCLLTRKFELFHDIGYLLEPVRI